MKEQRQMLIKRTREEKKTDCKDEHLKKRQREPEMFKTITRLLFGGEEQSCADVKSGDVVDEGWLVVSHPEAVSGENQGEEFIKTQPSNSALHGNVVHNMETNVSVLEAEATDQSGSTTSRASTGSVSKHEALVEVAQLTCLLNAKTWVNQPHMSRNAIQRHNRVRQGVQHNFFHLQQPGHRKLSH